MGCIWSKIPGLDIKLNDLTTKTSTDSLLKKKNVECQHEFTNETDIIEWKTLLEKLQANESIKSYALSLKIEQLCNIDDLIHKLSNLNLKDDIEKAWLIYNWITEHISYNINTFRKPGSNDPNTILKTGNCVCEGYSRLFIDLCQGLELEVKKVLGYSKGFNYHIGYKFFQTDHAWNAVKLNNKWYYVDTTWGAGSYSKDCVFSKKFSPYWFLTPPQIFIYSHYSNDLQLQKNKISLNDFESMLSVKLDFHLFGLECLTHSSSFIETRNTFAFIEFVSNKGILLVASLKKENHETKLDVIIQRDSTSHKFGVIAFLTDLNTEYELTLYAKHDQQVDEHLYNEVAKFIVVRTDNYVITNLPFYSLCYRFGIKCVSHSSSVINTKREHLFIEFSTPKEIFLKALLIGPNNQTIENCIIIQRDSLTQNQGLIISIPECNKAYKLAFYAKTNKKDTEFHGIGFFMLTRTGYEINQEISNYILLFDYGLKCLSHNSQVIYTETDTLFVEFEAFKETLIYPRLLLNNTELKDRVLVQRDSTFKYGIFIFIPMINQTYKLEINASNQSDRFYAVADFLIKATNKRQTGVIPKYSICYNYDLKLESHDCSLIHSLNRIVFIELSAPKETLLIAELNSYAKDSFSETIDKAVKIQRDSTSFKYGLFVLLPEKSKKYKLNLFAKNSNSQNLSYEHVGALLLKRSTDVTNYTFPAYKLKYDYGLECLSHSSEIIHSKTYQIKLVFKAPRTTNVLADLKIADVVSNNSTLVQRLNGTIEVDVLLPKSNVFCDLNLYAFDAEIKDAKMSRSANFKLITNEPVLNESRWIKQSPIDNIDSYIYEPLNYNLKLNEFVNFRLLVTNVHEVRLCDKDNNKYSFKCDNNSHWTLRKQLKIPGDLTIYIKEKPNSVCLQGLCVYNVT